MFLIKFIRIPGLTGPSTIPDWIKFLKISIENTSQDSIKNWRTNWELRGDLVQSIVERRGSSSSSNRLWTRYMRKLGCRIRCSLNTSETVESRGCQGVGRLVLRQDICLLVLIIRKWLVKVWLFNLKLISNRCIYPKMAVNSLPQTSWTNTPKQKQTWDDSNQTAWTWLRRQQKHFYFRLATPLSPVTEEVWSTMEPWWIIRHNKSCSTQDNPKNPEEKLTSQRCE